MKTSIIVGMILAVGAAVVGFFVNDVPEQDLESSLAEVRRGDFRIEISNEGTIAAKENITIHTKMKEFRGELTITKIIAKGAEVKKGDVLVEFDPSVIDTEISGAEVNLQASKSEVVFHREEVSVQKLQADVDIKQADYDVKMAEADIRKWKELEAPMGVRDARVTIQEAKYAHEEAKKNLEQMKILAKEDLASASEVARAEIEVEKTKNQFESAEMKLKLLQEYDHPANLARLENLFRHSLRLQAGKKSAAQSVLAQKESKLLGAETTLRERKAKVGHLKKDRKNFVLKAPAEGIVLYGGINRNYWYADDEQLKVGGKVNSHARLFTIPDLSGLKVSLQVNETNVTKVKVDQSVRVYPEAFSDLILEGKVKMVSTVGSDSRRWWESSGSGKFDVEVELEGSNERIRPGMKGKVHILVEEVKDVIYAPIDAVFEKDEKTVCTVIQSSGTEERVVKVGRSSDDYVEILEGLKVGEKVALYDPDKQ